MKTIHVLTPFDYRESHSTLIAFGSGYETEVSEECAAYAVAKGHAIYSAIAEDELFDRSAEHAEDEQIRAIIQSAHDDQIEDEGEAR